MNEWSDGRIISTIVAGILIFFLIIGASNAAVQIHDRERQHTERMQYLQVCDGKCETLP